MEGRQVRFQALVIISHNIFFYFRLQFGASIDIEVTSTFNIPYIVYTVTSHSSIVHMELVQLPQNSKSFIIQLKRAMDIVPNAYIYVHYIVNGNLHFCELALRLPHEFENQVSTHVIDILSLNI